MAERIQYEGHSTVQNGNNPEAGDFDFSCCHQFDKHW